MNKKKKTINETKTLTKQQQQRINKDKKQKYRKRRNNWNSKNEQKKLVRESEQHLKYAILNEHTQSKK